MIYHQFSFELLIENLIAASPIQFGLIGLIRLIQYNFVQISHTLCKLTCIQLDIA